LYQQNQDLISVGAYEAGSNPDIDQAIALRARLEHFLKQDMHINEDYEKTRQEIRELMAV
jgi:flagellum-specific ATP synthase